MIMVLAKNEWSLILKSYPKTTQFKRKLLKKAS